MEVVVEHMIVPRYYYSLVEVVVVDPPHGKGVVVDLRRPDCAMAA